MFITAIDSISTLFLTLIFLLFIITSPNNYREKVYCVYLSLLTIIFVNILILKIIVKIRIRKLIIAEYILISITFSIFCAMFYFYNCYLCNLLYFFSVLIDLLLIYQERKDEKLFTFFGDEAFILFTSMFYFFMISFSGLVTPTWLDQLIIDNYILN